MNLAKSNPSSGGLSETTKQPPQSYLAASILVTIFCCLPFGIVGIVNASRVESRYYNGDIIGAERASKNAKTWTLVALFCGLAIVLIYSMLSSLA
jgi:hypothetical protein